MQILFDNLIKIADTLFTDNIKEQVVNELDLLKEIDSIYILMIIVAILPLIIKAYEFIMEFYYSDIMDRMLMTKKQQKRVARYENIFTTLILSIVIMAIIVIDGSIDDLSAFWLFLTISVGIIIFLLGILLGILTGSINALIFFQFILLIVLSMIYGSLFVALLIIYGFIWVWNIKPNNQSQKNRGPEGLRDWLSKHIKDIMVTYLLIFLIECLLIIKEEVDKNDVILFTVLSSIIVASIFMMVMNAYAPNNKRIYILNGEENQEKKLYIYSAIDSNTFVCGISPRKESNGNQIMIISKSELENSATFYVESNIIDISINKEQKQKIKDHKSTEKQSKN